MDNKLIKVFGQANQLGKFIKANELTSQYGLTLNEKDVIQIMEGRKSTLKEQGRIEFGDSIALKIIYEFCNSDYLNQDAYVDTIIRLQDIFYLYKNEMLDEINDDELLHLMKEMFEHICFGDLDYLEGTCLSNFAKAIRAGYEGYKATDGYGEYLKFDEEKRWDYELYFETLKELCWR